MKNLVFVLGMLVATSAVAGESRQSEKLGIGIMQGEKQLNMLTGGDDVIGLNLSTEPFDISYPGSALNLCAWTDDSIFEKAKSGTDTMSDFTSCMFIYKSIAMAKKATNFYLSDGGGFTLNTAHGSTMLSEKRSTYHVTHFVHEGKGSEAVKFSSLDGAVYLVAWIDKDKNQVIDDGEFERFKVEFK